MKISTEEFLIEEYRSLRSEIELLYRLSFDAERNALVGLIVLYGFLFSSLTDALPNFEFSDVLWFLPVVLGVYARWRVSQYYRGMSLLGDYISAKIETAFKDDGEGGWETYLRRQAASEDRSMLGFFMSGGATAFWNAVVLLTTVTAVWQLAVGI